MTATTFESALQHAGGMSSKRAALFLHELKEPDRRWLLEQLDPSQRGTLRDLLAELTVLAVPVGAGPARTAQPVPAMPAPVSAAMLASPMTIAAERIMQTPMAEIAEILHREPDALVARVVWRLPAAWSRRLIARLDTERRARLTALSRGQGGGSRADALDLAVLQAVCERSGRHGVHHGMRRHLRTALKAIGRVWPGVPTTSPAGSEVPS